MVLRPGSREPRPADGHAPPLSDCAVAAEEDVLVIDLVRFLEREVPGWNEPMKVFYDGMHVTDDGSRRYAEHIADRLAAEVLPRLLERRAPGRETRGSRR